MNPGPPVKGIFTLNANDTRRNAHKLIDHIFHDLFPNLGMAERSEQVALSHKILDALIDGAIALCDAGTGSGKTYSYLAAGAAFCRSRCAGGQSHQPILISTSSIALQNAVQNEYLPVLSAVLVADGLIEQPMRSVIRKGKSHYVCPKHLERRLRQLDLSKKNWRAGAALLSLRGQLDMDGTAHILREFVEQIRVSETYTTDKQQKQVKIREIEIVYNFIGAFDFEGAREQSQTAQDKNIAKVGAA